MRKFELITVVLLIFCFKTTIAQNGYQIEFELKNNTDKKIILGYYLGDKNYIKDTLKTNNPNYFIAKGANELNPGIYFIYFLSKGKIIEFLVNKKEQHFKLNTDIKNSTKTMLVSGSNENKIFYDYLNFIEESNLKAIRINSSLKNLKTNTNDNNYKIKELTNELNKLNDTVLNYQKNTINKYPNSFTASLIKANLPIAVPDEISDKTDRYYYYKEHFFDNINFKNERILRSSILYPKIIKYIDELTYQNPDSIIVSVDKVLKLSQANDTIFKYVLVNMINKYAASKIVCMDAVYVHIVDNYYSKGKAKWVKKENLEKMQKNADMLRPNLCGKIAPDIILQTISKPTQTKSLYKINSKYTIIFMWNPDSKKSRESMADMLKFYNKFKDKGVEVFSICTNNNKETNELLKFIQEYRIDCWQNLINYNDKSNYKKEYNTENTNIYILNEKKEILAKNIGAEQISEVMNTIIENN